MKKLILFALALTLSINVYSQINGSDLGAAGLNFLLTNPNTASKLNTQETIALGLLGSLLRTRGQRQHELKVAGVPNSTITRDAIGNVFVTTAGVRTQVSKAMISYALSLSEGSTVGSTLKPYNMRQIEVDWIPSTPVLHQHTFIVPKGTDPVKAIYPLWPNTDGINWEILRRKKSGRFAKSGLVSPSGNMENLRHHAAKKTDKDYKYILIYNGVPNKIKTMFAYNWAEPITGVVYLADFNGIKNSFLYNEPINLAINYSAIRMDLSITFSIRDAQTGRLIVTESFKVNRSTSYVQNINLDTLKLEVGTYIITVKMMADGAVISSYKEKIEILDY